MSDSANQKVAMLEEQWRCAACRLATSPEEKRAAIRLLRQLAGGQPIDRVGLADALEVAPTETEAFLKKSQLDRMVYWDDEGRVAGFWGLSTIRTRHKLALEGRTLWTWCAEDSLFLPELLGETAEVESRDPESEERIHLTVSPQRIARAEPESVVLSMMRLDAADMTCAARLISSACHFIHFFVTRDSGERWIARHPGTMLLSLEEAFAFAQRHNAWLLEEHGASGKEQS
jgi:alkylmercury lyase